MCSSDLTPPPIADAIEADIARLMKDPAMRERLVKAGAQIAALPRARFTEMYLKDIERWKRVITQQGITLQ